MGYLIVDETGVGGQRREFDCVSCKHCQKVIRVVIRGVKKAYETKYRCSRCHGPICRFCGEQREGVCAPVAARIDDALKTKIWSDRFEHSYNTVPTS